MISEFPLFCFTTLAGLGIGAYAVNAVLPSEKEPRRAWLLPLVCLVLLAVGLLCLPLHLGRPERMLIALTQPGAMIAQEAYWAAAFGVVALIDLILSKTKGAAPRALRIVGAIAALGLMCVMANAYFVSLGIAAWASWQTFPVYVLGDLAMGAALVMVLRADVAENAGFVWASLALAVAAAVSFALEAAHFASVGADATLLIVGAVIAVASGAVLLAVKYGKLAAKTGSWVAFACLFVAVALARYGFYAACVL